MSTKDQRLYSSIFETKEADVRTFADLMRKELKKDKAAVPEAVSSDAFGEVMDGEAHKAIAAKFTQQQSGLVSIEHGWHGDDYVWHIGNSHPRREWKVSPQRLIYAIAATIDSMIPRDAVRINIYPPMADWDLKEYTVKALDLKHVWSVPQSSITALTEKLFRVLNALI